MTTLRFLADESCDFSVVRAQDRFGALMATDCDPQIVLWKRVLYNALEIESSARKMRDTIEGAEYTGRSCQNKAVCRKANSLSSTRFEPDECSRPHDLDG